MLEISDLFTLRPATSDDLPALGSLMSNSIGYFCDGHYTASQISGIIVQAINGRYNDLISKSTYYVLVSDNNDSQNPQQQAGAIVASGGWTPHRTIYSADAGSGSTLATDEVLDPKTDAAWIRGVYVHPDWAQRGLGMQLMRECEAAAHREAGFGRLKLASTLNAVPFYERCGYVQTGEKEVGLPAGETMVVVMMEKELPKDGKDG